MGRGIKNAGKAVGKGVKKAGQAVGKAARDAIKAATYVGTKFAEDALHIRKTYPKAPLTYVNIKEKLKPIKNKATNTAGQVADSMKDMKGHSQRLTSEATNALD